MFKVIKSALAVLALVMVSNLAMAQSDSTTTDEATPMTTDGNSDQNSDGTVVSDPNETGLPDSTGVAGTSANDKPATRYKLYSGKQRGNNVIFDPKK